MSKSPYRPSVVALLIVLLVLTTFGCSSDPDGNAAGQSESKIALAMPQAPEAPANSGIRTPLPRKIIYTAEITMVTDTFARTAESIAGTVKAHDGYIAETSMQGSAESVKSGTWKVRIPVARFDAFMKALGGLGEVENSTLTSQDVSEEFYDLAARLKNKRVEEERLIQHLQRSTGKLSEILAVERELTRVREEIERMEGRQRFLANQTDFTTVTISLRELVSLHKEDAPGFGTQIARTFIESLAALGSFGQAITLALVAFLPWVAVGAGIIYPLYRLARRSNPSATRRNILSEPNKRTEE